MAEEYDDKGKAKEDDERDDAAERYYEERPQHFVDLCNESIRESKDANTGLRQDWDELYDAYETKMPGVRGDADPKDEGAGEGGKEPWQSDIVINKPFSTVQQAKSVIRKALISGSHSFYDLIKKRQYQNIGSVDQFVKAAKIVIDEFQGEHNGDFPMAFADAVEMAFVLGHSSEMIPIFHKGKFRWELTPPWDIFRDPYARPRDPQSGNYWIRKVRLDAWELFELEKKGIFVNVDQAIAGQKGTQGSQDGTEKNKRARDEFERSSFTKTYDVNDYFGRLIAPSGELLLERGRFSVCGDNLIRVPKKVPYPTLRWPGVSFSALPHLTRFEGRGLIEGVLALWELFNNLLNLHVDNLSWEINNAWERDPSRLMNPLETGIYPGAVFDIKPGGDSSTPVHRPLITKHTTSEALANMEFISRQWQEGSFVNDMVTGLPGSRSEITKGEVEIKSAQSMGVFHSMAKDLEVGGRQALWASYEIIATSIRRDHEVFDLPEMSPEMRDTLYKSRHKLSKYVNIAVTGISNLTERNELISRIEAAMVKAEHPMFARYTKPYRLLKAYYDAIDLDKYSPVVNEEESKVIDQQMKKQMQAEGITTKKPQGGNSGQARTG